jgi:leucyl-tRNA synthetase
LEWSDAGVEGANRFLRRLWKAVYDHVNLGVVAPYHSGELNADLKALRLQLHTTIVKVTDDLGRRHSFNTAISSVMELMNALAKVECNDDALLATYQAVRQEVLQNVALLLSPMVPHICQAIWAELCPNTAILEAAWPTADEKAMVQDHIEYMIQVNGKLRGNMTVAKSESKEALEKLALTQPCVLKYSENMTVRKVIVVPNKLINVVVG